MINIRSTGNESELYFKIPTMSMACGAFSKAIINVIPPKTLTEKIEISKNRLAEFRKDSASGKVRDYPEY